MVIVFATVIEFSDVMEGFRRNHVLGSMGYSGSKGIAVCDYCICGVIFSVPLLSSINPGLETLFKDPTKLKTKKLHRFVGLLVRISRLIKYTLVVAGHSCCMQVFEKFSKPMLGRKELFKNALRKAAYAWKLINDLRLTGTHLTNCTPRLGVDDF
ncbi:hypothetical protein L1987_52534 [Smallanthus sonchifolius]|uniref:Uncharacterized protein n=1 Tax=Smallanthus sonchifolius TaxID=185202 RepID=A0ACB9ETU4_9ASTR|nr:hypothetical protein L1987_52534 [Smallanthus sonchifolius]